MSAFGKIEAFLAASGVMTDSAFRTWTGVQPGDVELIDAYSTYQQGRGFSPKTVERRGAALRNLCRHMAPLTLGAVTPADLDQWLPRLRRAHAGQSGRDATPAPVSPNPPPRDTAR